MNRVRIAIVGTNFISDRFAEAASLSKKARVCAIYSRKLDTGAVFAQRHGIKKVYDSYEKMLADSEIDAVYIASPHVAHAAQAVGALDAGKHVLCETAMERSGRVILEAVRPDFDPALEIIKAILPRLGKIRRVRFEYCQYSSRYDRFKSGDILNAFNPEMKNTALADIGIYPLHICALLFGAPESIGGESVFLSNGFEAMGNITMGYGDMLAEIVYSKITESVNPSVIEGENGSITIDKLNAPTEIKLKMRDGEWQTLDYVPAENNMVYEIDAFSDMVGGVLSSLPFITATECAMRVVDEVYRTRKISKYFQNT